MLAILAQIGVIIGYSTLAVVVIWFIVMLIQTLRGPY